jgi:hypothetical protein
MQVQVDKCRVKIFIYTSMAYFKVMKDKCAIRVANMNTMKFQTYYKKSF